MKLLYCSTCGDMIVLNYQIKLCNCGASAGIYLDKIGAAVTSTGIVVGIDNNSFFNAVKTYTYAKENYPDKGRMDFFFCGWIPTLPGEVVVVETIQDIKSLLESKLKTEYTTSSVPVSVDDPSFQLKLPPKDYVEPDRKEMHEQM